jgi:hypothetical protein
MSLLFFGDSFTAGAELLDYQFYDNYPAPVSLADLQSEHMKDWRNKNKTLQQIKNKSEFDQIRERQRLHAYPRKLAELCGREHKDLSVGGSSLQRIKYLLTTEVHQNRESRLTVFIQPPPPERWMEYVQDKWIDFIVGNQYSNKFHSLDIESYFQFKVIANTEYSRFCEWLLDLQAIYDFCVNNKKIKDFYFINSGVFNRINDVKNDYKDLIDVYNSLMSNISKKIFHFPHTKNNEGINFLPWGHVTEDNHRELAIDIHDKIC